MFEWKGWHQGAKALLGGGGGEGEGAATQFHEICVRGKPALLVVELVVDRRLENNSMISERVVQGCGYCCGIRVLREDGRVFCCFLGDGRGKLQRTSMRSVRVVSSCACSLVMSMLNAPFTTAYGDTQRRFTRRAHAQLLFCRAPSTQ